MTIILGNVKTKLYSCTKKKCFLQFQPSPPPYLTIPSIKSGPLLANYDVNIYQYHIKHHCTMYCRKGYVTLEFMIVPHNYLVKILKTFYKDKKQNYSREYKYPFHTILQLFSQAHLIIYYVIYSFSFVAVLKGFVFQALWTAALFFISL